MTNFIKLDKENFLFNYKDNAYDALISIESNGHGIVFLTNQNQEIIASLSDGDIRRWLINDGHLNIPSVEIANKLCKSITYENEESYKDKLYSFHQENPNLQLIPIINNKKKIVWVVKVKN